MECDLGALDPEVVAIGPGVVGHVRDLVHGEPSEPDVPELLDPVGEEDPELITHLLVIPVVLLRIPLLGLLPGLLELLERVNPEILPLIGVDLGPLLDEHLLVKDLTLLDENAITNGVELLDPEDHVVGEEVVLLLEVDEVGLGPIRHGREVSPVGAPHVLEVEGPALVQVILGDLSDLGSEGGLGDVLAHCVLLDSLRNPLFLCVEYSISHTGMEVNHFFEVFWSNFWFTHS